MNFIQFGSFFLYVFCVFCGGLGIYCWLNPKNKSFINNSVLVGETLLLGNIWTIGLMLLLSLLHLYYPLFLWIVVGLNALALINKNVRCILSSLFKRENFSLSAIVLFLLLLLLFVRNSYFLVDVDSHSSYLYAQNLWLFKGTSVFSQIGIDDRIYSPHFDCVPYALTLKFFGADTIFPLMINFMWRAISLILLFGYVKHRFNGLYALGGVILIMFNDHFFFSGANQWVIINGALIALVFACAYNFWESRASGDSFRFLLAMVFLSQFIANKLQYVYVSFFVLILGLMIQTNIKDHLRNLFKKREYFVAFLVSILFVSLWYIKNYFATGLAVYPAYAWTFNTLGWTAEKGHAAEQTFRGLGIFEFLKYSSYLSIWPGIQSLKLVFLSIIFLPFTYILLIKTRKFEQDKFFELCFWLILSFLIVMGSCMASHQDPRYFRYPIALFTFAAIFSIHYLAKDIFRINAKIIGILLCIFALTGYKIILLKGGGGFIRPSLTDNIKVLTNQMHFEDVIERHYPFNTKAEIILKKHPELIDKMAWHNNVLSAFLLPYPIMPQIDLWMTNVIQWYSYDDKDLVIKDLKDHNIEWILDVIGKEVLISSPEEFAERIYGQRYQRYPKTINYPYTMPKELIETHYTSEYSKKIQKEILEKDRRP